MALIPALRSRGREISEFEACLICRMSSLCGMRNPLLKKRKEGQREERRKERDIYFNIELVIG